MNETGIRETIQTIPPVAVTTLSWCGVAIQDWVLVATLLYTLIQILRVIPKIYGCAVCFSRNLSCDRSCLKR